MMKIPFMILAIGLFVSTDESHAQMRATEKEDRAIRLLEDRSHTAGGRGFGSLRSSARAVALIRIAEDSTRIDGVNKNSLETTPIHLFVEKLWEPTSVPVPIEIKGNVVMDFRMTIRGGGRQNYLSNEYDAGENVLNPGQRYLVFSLGELQKPDAFLAGVFRLNPITGPDDALVVSLDRCMAKARSPMEEQLDGKSLSVFLDSTKFTEYDALYLADLTDKATEKTGYTCLTTFFRNPAFRPPASYMRVLFGNFSASPDEKIAGSESLREFHFWGEFTLSRLILINRIRQLAGSDKEKKEAVEAGLATIRDDYNHKLGPRLEMPLPSEITVKAILKEIDIFQKTNSIKLSERYEFILPTLKQLLIRKQQGLPFGD